MTGPDRKVDVLGLHRCSTCRKVVQSLVREGIEVRQFRDIREEPLKRSELEAMAQRVGGVARLFSRRAVQYRTRGLDRRELGESEMLDLMLSEPTFVTRPLVLAIGRNEAFCGSSARAMAKFVRSLSGSS